MRGSRRRWLTLLSNKARKECKALKVSHLHTILATSFHFLAAQLQPTPPA
jgi:hypothetical protein